MIDVVGGVLAVIGAVVVLVAATALHRFDTPVARVHAAGKASSFGVVAALCGVAVVEGGGDGVRLVVAALVFVVTVAAAVSLLARVVDVPDQSAE